MLTPRTLFPRFVFLVGCLVLAADASSASYKTELTVAADGSGDYFRIQDAIDDCKSFPDEAITVRIKAGRYREKVTVPSWNTKLVLIGEGEVVIAYNSHFKSVDRGRNSTFFSGTLEVLASDFTARNLTIENTSGPVGQAIALRVEGDRCSFYDCRLIGNQDTLYLAGEGHRQYFENCLIEGTTDYVFGGATAYFEKCVLRCKSDSYITAASTPKSSAHGFVFNKCKVEAAEGVSKVYLGRPWRMYAKTVFLDCDYGEGVIVPVGWKNWGHEDPGTTVYYAEYIAKAGNKIAKDRVDWSKQLKKADLARFEFTQVFGDWRP